MRSTALALLAVVGFGLCSRPALLQQKGGGDETGPYDVVTGWPRPFARQGYIQGSQGGVFAESPNRIFLANRGEIKLPDPLRKRVRRSAPLNSTVHGARSGSARRRRRLSCAIAS